MNTKSLTLVGCLLVAAYLFSTSKKTQNIYHSKSVKHQTEKSHQPLSTETNRLSEAAADTLDIHEEEIEPGVKLDPSEKRWIASELQSAVKAGIIQDNQKEQYKSVLFEELKRDREVMTEELMWGDDENATE